MNNLRVLQMEERVRRAAVYIKDAIEGKETKSRSPLGTRQVYLFDFLFFFLQPLQVIENHGNSLLQDIYHPHYFISYGNCFWRTYLIQKIHLC